MKGIKNNFGCWPTVVVRWQLVANLGILDHNNNYYSIVSYYVGAWNDNKPRP